MAARKYEPGQTINGILFLRDAEKAANNPHRVGVFQCPFCSNTFTIWLQHVSSGNTSSCGCHTYTNRPKKHGHSRSAKHRSRTYNTWAKMITRCTNPNYTKAHLYFNKGIRVCERWRKFENFLADMGERPEGKTLDRFPDRNGNYEPGNCRWATIKEQNRNTSTTKIVEINGREIPLIELSERYGVNHKTSLARFNRGFSINKIFERYVVAEKDFAAFNL